jgi:orotate phosphoribosyltransferase
MREGEVLDLLRDSGALLTGHFLLSSGKHSPAYVEKARVFERPPHVIRLGRALSGRFRGVEAVVSPAVGALPLGFTVALEAGARFLYAERREGRMDLRRGFRLGPGERTLVVEDVVTTGGSAAEVFSLVRGSGAEALGVAAMVDRSAGNLPFPLESLARVEAEVFEPDACPLCDDGVPLQSPGSRHLT